MIYECPNCHVPQAAGRTSCHHCGAEFEGPVPADALVPEAVAAGAGTPPTPPPADALPQPPPLQEVNAPHPPPRAAELPPYQPPPSYAPPAYAPPSGYAQTVYTPPPRASGFSLPKGLLIAIPIVLALVLGAVFFASSLNQGGETPPPPSAAMTPRPSEMAVRGPAPAPAGGPLVLSGNSSAAAGGSAPPVSPDTAWLAGRWQSKSTDFYVFNQDGTGSRGSISGKQAKSSFLWQLVQKQLVLTADAEKPETLAFSQGSDDNTLYLRGADGRYVQYTRAKTGS